MKSEQTKSETDTGAMRKRRVTMADGRRYLIYYTFGNEPETAGEIESGNGELSAGNYTNEGKNV